MQYAESQHRPLRIKKKISSKLSSSCVFPNTEPRHQWYVRHGQVFAACSELVDSDYGEVGLLAHPDSSMFSNTTESLVLIRSQVRYHCSDLKWAIAWISPACCEVGRRLDWGGKNTPSL